jgi:hypothetical protein
MRIERWVISVTGIMAFSARAQLADDVLYASIVGGETQAISAHLNMGGDPNAELSIPNVNEEISLLELSMRARNEQAAVLLLEAGAMVDDVGLLIEWAAEVGFSDVMRFLLDEDPGRLLAMRPDSHPLVIAIGYGHHDVASLLLDRMTGIIGGAERQEILNEALMAATATYGGDEGDELLVDDLLKAGASASTTLVLAGAVLQCDPGLISVFLAAGADPGKQYDAGRGGFAPIEYAVRCFERDDIASETAEAVLEELTDAGADLCLLANRSSMPPPLAAIVARRCP